MKVKSDEPAFRELERLEREFRRGKKPLASREDRQAFCDGWWKQVLEDGEEVADKLPRKAATKLCDFILSVNPRTRFSDPRPGWALAELTVVLCRAAAAVGMPLAPPPLVSTLPIPYLNAWTLNVRGTHRRLVILNDAFFVYPLNVAKAIIQVLMPEVSGDGEQIKVDRSTILAAMRADPEVVRIYDENMMFYLGRSPRPDEWVLQPALAREGRVGLQANALYLSKAMQLFALGHEFAHQLLKHQLDNGSSTGPSGGASLVFGSSRARMWAKELEADAYGFLLMAAALTVVESDTKRAADYVFPFAVAAPRLLFAFWAAAERREIIANGGVPEATVSEGDEAMALDAVREMFRGGAAVTKEQVLPVETDRPSHPPLWLRALLAAELERNALGMHGGSTDMLDQGDLYAYAQAMLEEQVFRSHRLQPGNYFLPREGP